MRAAKDHAEVDKEEKRTLLEGGVEVRETEKMTIIKSLTLPRTCYWVNVVPSTALRLHLLCQVSSGSFSLQP